MVTRLERVEDDSDYTKNVQRYWKGAVRDSRRRPCPTKPFQLALGQRRRYGPPLPIMSHTEKQIPAVPVGSADLNQGPTASPMGRGDVIQVLLPNMARTATHKPRTNKDKVTELHLATYNVRTLSDECHLVSLENEIEKKKWDIIGISEMRRPGENVVELASQHIMFNKGNDKKQGERRMQPARGRFARFDLDRQIASTFPAHWKVGPAPVFWASQPLEPAEWLALLILKAGDVESNPGPQNRKLPPSALTTQTTTLNSTTHSHATTSHPNQKLLTLLQLNINSITNKHEELKLLVTELQPDIITIQETKLKKHNKTPQIPTYSAIRTDRANGKGGGLLTYIKHNITFSDTKIPNFINPINTELQIIQLHITHTKNLHHRKYIHPP